MKRKKWSEQEEQTLLSKYSDLLNSGALAKLKTREKKFRPIAEHVNSVHHMRDPIGFPFNWSWRDVSIKVQNMRHQYLGVKQKIRVSEDEFNWRDGEIHWENFLKYKEVFGDVELAVRGKRAGDDGLFGYCCDLGFGIGCEGSETGEDEEEDGQENGDNAGVDCGEKVGKEGKFMEGEKIEETGVTRARKTKKGFGRNKGLGLLASQVTNLRDVVLKREEKKRERDFAREKEEFEREGKRREMRFSLEEHESKMNDWIERREMEADDFEHRRAIWEFDQRARLERELEEERQRRRRMEEKTEEEEMEWRGKMLGLQIEHEKALMQMQIDALQNQMQVLGMMARVFCQFLGSANDGLGVLGPQILHNLHHSGGLPDNSGKPDSNSPSDFM